MTPLSFFLFVGLGAIAVALATPSLRGGRGSLQVTCAVVVIAGALTVPLVAISSFGPDGLATVTRSIMRGLYPTSAFILGGALWLAIRHIGSPASALGLRHPGRIAEALALHTAAWFITFDLGKVVHDAEMRQFFAASQLPLWSMYAVLVAEILSAIGLCLPKSRVLATRVLSVIMLGAIATHLRNGDPFSDSLDAVRMLLFLLCTHAFARSNKLA